MSTASVTVPPLLTAEQFAERPDPGYPEELVKGPRLLNTWTPGQQSLSSSMMRVHWRMCSGPTEQLVCLPPKMS
jgi:hypothetical protein